MEYLASQIRSNARLPGWILDNICKEIAGVTIAESEHYGVDHQSQWVLPVDWSGAGFDKDFLVARRDYLEQDGVVVLGGNDNTDDKHPLLNGIDEPDMPLSPMFKDGALDQLVVCRQDG